METNHQKDALRILRLAGEMEENSMDLAEVALALAVLDRPQMDPAPYRDHLAALVDQIKAETAGLTLDDQLRALRRVLVVQHKYQGEESLSDDPQCANLMQVIDRRQGVSPALGVIYLHVAEALGWPMMGLDYAGHFLVRLGGKDGAAILDPARAGQTCSSEMLHDLGAQEDEDTDLVADDDDDDDDQGLGSYAQVAPDYALIMSKRDVLLRLQNNLKRRLLARNKLDGAISTLQGMILMSPKRPALWRELGYLQSERGSLRAAITALEVVYDLADEPADAVQTEAMLRQLRWQLN